MQQQKDQSWSIWNQWNIEVDQTDNFWVGMSQDSDCIRPTHSRSEGLSIEHQKADTESTSRGRLKQERMFLGKAQKKICFCFYFSGNSNKTQSEKEAKSNY